jgi:hypothetical protein
MAMRTIPLAVVLTLASVGCNRGPAPANPPANPPPLPVLPENAPKDQPVDVRGQDKAKQLEDAIAPYVEQARKTYPQARKRYLDGLPPGHTFYVVTKLRDANGTIEQVFIAVSGIQDGRISGRIANDLRSVRGYKNGDPYSFPEGELIDWLISRPDGSEEGNVVGKFLDEWQKTHEQ